MDELGTLDTPPSPLRESHPTGATLILRLEGNKLPSLRPSDWMAALPPGVLHLLCLFAGIHTFPHSSIHTFTFTHSHIQTLTVKL